MLPARSLQGSGLVPWPLLSGPDLRPKGRFHATDRGRRKRTFSRGGAGVMVPRPRPRADRMVAWTTQ
ncbi:MAG: hypothetical protein AVDCRST_MAG01-01-1702 [uncultured Rubrobacteraceae bacterium]|uniref:Uncharacterized protein n=1 Tax=uncultured Rubrobacteraceae bacterium TaxID=349277 RepID=A0A6J4PCX7_9ACTN|nr:MAG: hypothetical protein AVDCRST_MAG01-01-1702 [uncultured Rubrobacteraceae bacterium]